MSKEQHINPSDHITQASSQARETTGKFSTPFSLKEICCTARRPFILSALLIFAFLFAYGEVFISLVHQWWSNDMYSYGFLIPWISLYLVWTLRENLRHIEITPNFLVGFGILSLGLILLVAGQAGAILAVQEVSLVITISGIVLLLLGNRFMQALWLPIAYLLFMIPIWEVVTDRLHFPFQNFSANIGLILLQSIGVPAFRQGIYIDLPNITLEVAKVCSGVNYLIAIIAVGIPMAYLFLKSWSKRLLLICFAVIIAVLANGVRVALIGTLSYYGLSGNIHGPLHILQGLFVSVVGFGALFVGLWVLSRTSMRSPSSDKHQNISFSTEGSKVKTDFESKKKGVIPLAIFTSILLLLIGGHLHFRDPLPVPLKIDLKYFPLEIGRWKGMDMAPPDDNVFRHSGTDQELLRTYSDTSGKTIRLYMGYHEYQKQGKELINYKIREIFQTPLRTTTMISTRHGQFEVNQTVLKGNKTNQLVLFWYDLNGHVVSDPYRVQIWTLWDNLRFRKTNGAVIMLSEDFQDHKNLPEILADGEEFIGEITPVLKKYLPQGE